MASIRLRFVLPAALFAGIATTLAVGLTLKPSQIPSVMIDQPVPEFALPPVMGRPRGLSSPELTGEVRLVNFFASWCAACRIEHPLLNRLTEDRVVPVYGINYKDNPEDARRWLDQLGDPYVRSGADFPGARRHRLRRLRPARKLHRRRRRPHRLQAHRTDQRPRPRRYHPADNRGIAPMRAFVLGLLVVLASGPALAIGAGEGLDDPLLEARARDIGKVLRCLVCQNQSIDDSNAGLAKDLRRLVRERLAAGDSDQAVKDYIVARYGDYVLLKPPFKASTYALWLGPAAILLLAGAGTALFLRRQSRGPLAAAPLDDDERRRLESLLDEG